MVLCDGYRWKNFRGPAEHRQPYAGVWYRYDSGGWKVFEFLELCEAAGIDTCVVTLPVTETVADLEDLAEYAFGPASSTWGALRVKDGRAKPYRPFIIEIGNENTLNYTQPEANPCRDGCQNFTKRWLERALAMDGKAQALGLNLTFVVGFDAGIGGGQSCSQETVRQSKASIVELGGWAAQLGERAVWDCHTGGDSPADGAVTAGALIELRQILRDAGSDMRAAVLEENGGTHNMLRMLGHVTQNHALSRLGEFIVVNTVATGLQPLGRNSNGWDQGNIYFTPNASWLAPPAVATRMIAEASQGLPEVLNVTAPPALDVLASKSTDGTRLGIRVANPTNASVQADFQIDGMSVGVVQAQVLAAASPLAVRVESVRSNTSLQALAKGWTFPPYSFTTFRAEAHAQQDEGTVVDISHGQPDGVMVGAHYFSGWYHCSGAGCYSHFHGFTPTGKRTLNIFDADAYPERIPLLGNLTVDESTIAAEIETADKALDFFDVLYYDGGMDCGMAPGSDPNLRYCLDSALAFMLNSSSVWGSTRRLHFFISYSNDIDRSHANVFVGAAGEAKWSGLVRTWVSAMRHPRYLKVDGRPVFKILIPDIFVTECGGNATLATLRLDELRAAARQAGLKNPIVGGGWQNPGLPSGAARTEMPGKQHPDGFIRWNRTQVNCTECTIKTVAVSSLLECEAMCNVTTGCTAITIQEGAGQRSCEIKKVSSPGIFDSSRDTLVRVPGQVQYDWTGTYNAAPPVCRPPTSQGSWVCPRYRDSWFPNATSKGARIFPYAECGDWQGAVRTIHADDRVPYLANVIAGFDPRPWEEHAPSFAMPSAREWEAVLRQAKAQCLNASNRFGFPDASAPHGYQPAVNIYAWNEFGEGGITAPTRGEGRMKVEVLARVFGG